MADTSAYRDLTTAPVPGDVDLDAIERDLRDVETALNRLADGTYWTDEVDSPDASGDTPTTPAG